MKRILESAAVIFTLILACSAQAALVTSHYIVAPQCLLDKADFSHTQLAAYRNLKLIRTNDSGVDQLMAAKVKPPTLLEPCGGFVDVTAAWNEKKKVNPRDFLTSYARQTELVALNQKIIDYKIQYEAEVNQLLKTLNPSAMWSDLQVLTAFSDRYINSKHGLEAATWLKTQVELLAKNANRTDVTTQFVQTGFYKQPSLVVKLGNSTLPGIVIGAHMDTLNSTFELKPGADDDGSGSVTVMQIARTLIQSHLQFEKPIYFIWYAGEEEGLIGSGYVVKHFKEQKIPVEAVLHFDMTGFAYQNDPTIYLINDNVNENLTHYLETLITTYVKQPVKYSRCGYQCSDHATWNQAGYPASLPFEAAFEHYNPDIHSSRDQMEKLSLTHMDDFAKLGVAFGVELAGVNTSSKVAKNIL